MAHTCTIEQQPPLPTLCVKTRTPVTEIGAVLGKAFGEIMSTINARGAAPIGMPYVAYRNMDMADLDVEIGFPVSKPVAGAGRVEPGTLPGGAWASTLHVGPYADVGPAWADLQAFIRAQGKTAAPTGYEFYFDGPDTPPDRIRTRVAFPLLS
jgi:effector-binding domain-containing protein